MEETRNATYSNKEDRISRLPDALIHHILSFIDAKYAVQTSVLSKRWIHIWKSLSFLNFNRSSFSLQNTERFIEFVYMVFIFRDDTNIQKFSVDWENSAFDYTAIMNVNRWSLNAVKHEVQEISIVITQCHISAYEIPHHLLNCKSLRKLGMMMFSNARHADVILPRSMNLPRLKVLSITGLSISNEESSKRLFSSCPVLETLAIQNCDIQTYNGRKLIVDSVSVKKFAYTFLCRRRYPQNGTKENIVKLCAPNLKDFFCALLLKQDCSLEICFPLSRVSFHMILENLKDENAETYSKLPLGEKEVYAKRVMRFLEAVYMVKEMRLLSPGFLEVLSRAPDVVDCQPPRLCSLKYLTLTMWSTRSCMRAIVYLLSISPNVTKLFLKAKETLEMNGKQACHSQECCLTSSMSRLKWKDVMLNSNFYVFC
ncbi:FBD-associated F-box protein At5g60610-like isoform X2 [Papaver somniferum]|uniref:FBD-associated F-box protein At5g60610-like isoform X2 n=1 Tax=Papaver somniferum TaxID=3469 RepID=UPI000E703B07|nr:FBD-associated F-box protein At5g60610-like isoform X2 [Papaver somniferum]